MRQTDTLRHLREQLCPDDSQTVRRCKEHESHVERDWDEVPLNG